MATSELSRAGGAAEAGCESVFQRPLHSLDYTPGPAAKPHSKGPWQATAGLGTHWANSLRHWKRTLKEGAAQSAALCCISGVPNPSVYSSMSGDAFYCHNSGGGEEGVQPGMLLSILRGTRRLTEQRTASLRHERR